MGSKNRVIECVEHNETPTGDGYGMLPSKKCPERMAHRKVWHDTFGPIPEGLCVMHLCDNTRCMNPHHLVVGSLAANNYDMWRKGRHNPGRLVGADNPNARLTATDVRAIRRLYACGGHTHATLARQFGVGAAQIGNILAGRSWSHVG